MLGHVLERQFLRADQGLPDSRSVLRNGGYFEGIPFAPNGFSEIRNWNL
jgi:hypothetical protein